MSVIVRPAEAAVASNNAILSKCLLEVTTKLKSIVSLHHLEMEAKKNFWASKMVLAASWGIIRLAALA